MPRVLMLRLINRNIYLRHRQQWKKCSIFLEIYFLGGIPCFTQVYCLFLLCSLAISVGVNVYPREVQPLPFGLTSNLLSSLQQSYFIPICNLSNQRLQHLRCSLRQEERQLQQREIRMYSLEQFTFVWVQRRESIIQVKIAVVLIDAQAV